MTELSDAVRDLRYLLDRGYSRESAVDFVSNHYRLSLNLRHLLARCVFSRTEATDHRAKAVSKTKVGGKRLGVDGYNALITIESILMGRRVVLCDDGFVRDLRAIFGKYKPSRTTGRALTELFKILVKTRPNEVMVFFDKQVSRSGELAARVRAELKRFGLKGDSQATGGVDFMLRTHDVVASSDRAVIEKAKAVWDIPAEILRFRKAKLLDLTKL